MAETADELEAKIARELELDDDDDAGDGDDDDFDAVLGD